MRPLVVSMTSALFLSRLAGKDCDNAGAASTRAARKANKRIMLSPRGMEGEKLEDRDRRSQIPLHLETALRGRVMRYVLNFAFRLAATEAGTKAEKLPPMPAI